MLGLYLLQNKLIFPGAASQGASYAVVRSSENCQVEKLQTRHQETIAVMFGKARQNGNSVHPQASDQPTIIYFYGNGMSMSNCDTEFMRMRRLGFNVLVAEFVGYGMSSGKPSETGVYDTADAAFDYLLKRPDVNPKKIVPVGWSLGSTAAVYLAATRQVPCVATFSAFTSMPDVAQHTLPWFPTRWLVKYQFDNKSRLANIACPVFLAHGTVDNLVPFKMNAELASVVKTEKKVIPVVDAGHNDVFDMGGDDLLSELKQFIDKYSK
jgi:uncharacterized protein